MSLDYRLLPEVEEREWRMNQQSLICELYLADAISSSEFYDQTTTLLDLYRAYVAARLRLWKTGYIPTPNF